VRKGFVAGGLFSLVGLLAACGGGSGSVSAKSSSKPAAQPATAAATVKTASSSLGTILVDASGKTLYAFMPDSATMSACTASCAMLWPPLTATGAPVAGTGVTASMLTTITDANGTQVVYGGHPLYTFMNDSGPGQTNGQGFANGLWHVVSPSGQIVTSSAPATTPSTSGSGSGSSGGGGGYGY
jgi:predicted lipoprotein with Yx(FWY)xxD motif